MQLVNNNYEFMLSFLPHYLKKNKRVQAFYKAISFVFDIIDDDLNKIDRMHLIDEAKGEFLDDLGELVGEQRNGADDERYRKKIKLAFRLTNFVPHLNNLLEICKYYTGLNPKIKEGWQVDGEPARYDVDFITNSDYDFGLIDDLSLDKITGAGIKINSRKCVDNYKTAFYADDFYSNDTDIESVVGHFPLCE